MAAAEQASEGGPRHPRGYHIAWMDAFVPGCFDGGADRKSTFNATAAGIDAMHPWSCT